MTTDYGALPSDDAAWLDVIPGGRQAYDYVTRELSRFNLVGLESIPEWKRTLQAVGPIAQGADPVTRSLFDQANNDVLDLQGTWELLQDQVTTILAKLRSVGLGVVPIATLAAIAAALVAVSAGLVLFFNSANQRQQQVADLVNRMVALGKLTAAQGAALLREGSAGSWFDSLGSKVILGTVALGALWLFLNSRRRA